MRAEADHTSPEPAPAPAAATRRSAAARGLALGLALWAGGRLFPARAQAPRPAPPSRRPWPWVGVTTDDPNTDTAAQVEALASLPRRVALRVVLDEGTPPGDYVDSVRRLAAVADVMALPLDSSWMAGIGAAQAGRRIRHYIEALGDAAALWEVGNEVNGNWVGPDAVGKIEAMFDAARAYGKRTALTFFHENPATPGHAMLPWIDAHIPPGHRLRTGLDYVLVSYYEDENGGHVLTPAEVEAIFSGLAQRFPYARLGFGEFGWGRTIPPHPARRAALIRRVHGYQVPQPRFVGGGFYWHFRQTMVPVGSADLAVLRELLAP